MKPIEINNNMNWRLSTFTLIALAALISGCSGERSGATGWAFNTSGNGGFERQAFFAQETAPGLVFIEGGTFTMGQVEEDLTMAWDNIPRRVTVSSFYMDETEVTNGFWLEYMFWLGRVYGSSYPEVVDRALPDTLVWREKLSFNEPFVNYYLRHPAYRDYPVVGISWNQANNFCKWRTDRVNEQLLVREGLIAHNPDGQMDEDHFTTDGYLNGQYQGEPVAEGLTDYRPNSSGYRNVKFEDGLFQPSYRLPTEAEWEFACRAGTTTAYSFGDNITPKDAIYGGSAIGAPAAIGSYKPNAFGLYDMHGNVWEWCEDWYGGYPGWPVEDPKGPAVGQYRILRGGSFAVNSMRARSCSRIISAPAVRIHVNGFRLVKDE